MKDTEQNESTSAYARLTSFKEYATVELRGHIEATYGLDVFANYIYPYYEDMLECIENHIEDLGEQSIQDEEFSESLAIDEQNYNNE